MEILEDLHKIFNPPELNFLLINELEHLKFDPLVGIEKYITKIESLLTQVKPGLSQAHREIDLKIAFKRGLPEDLQKDLMKYPRNSYSEWVTYTMDQIKTSKTFENANVHFANVNQTHQSRFDQNKKGSNQQMNRSNSKNNWKNQSQDRSQNRSSSKNNKNGLTNLQIMVSNKIGQTKNSKNQNLRNPIDKIGTTNNLNPIRTSKIVKILTNFHIGNKKSLRKNRKNYCKINNLLVPITKK